MAKEKSLSELTREARQYADLRIDEAKLKATRGLSTALGQTLSYLLIFAVLALVLGLLSLALLQWLNGLLGAPWGTLIISGIFLVVLVVLWMKRQDLFRDLFVKLFIDVFYDTENDE
ncbi:MAG: phage holin family protein [Bacteroidales bacterium]|nr:phage holin family protein [Bacteroidales bacterium]